MVLVTFHSVIQLISLDQGNTRRVIFAPDDGGIGVGVRVAKIASEINKPNGQFEVKPEEVPRFMQDLQVRKIWGIGEKSERKLEELGVKTCCQFQRFHEWS